MVVTFLQLGRKGLSEPQKQPGCVASLEVYIILVCDILFITFSTGWPFLENKNKTKIQMLSGMSMLREINENQFFGFFF